MRIRLRAQGFRVEGLGHTAVEQTQLIYENQDQNLVLAFGLNRVQGSGFRF